MLLLIDFYEKTAVSSKRRAQMNKVGGWGVLGGIWGFRRIWESWGRV